MGILDSFHFDVSGASGDGRSEGVSGDGESEGVGGDGESEGVGGDGGSERGEELESEREPATFGEDDMEMEGARETEGEREVSSLQQRIHDTIVLSILPSLTAFLTKV